MSLWHSATAHTRSVAAGTGGASTPMPDQHWQDGDSAYGQANYEVPRYTIQPSASQPGPESRMVEGMPSRAKRHLISSTSPHLPHHTDSSARAKPSVETTPQSAFELKGQPTIPEQGDASQIRRGGTWPGRAIDYNDIHQVLPPDRPTNH